MRQTLGLTWIDPEEYAYPAGSLRQSRRKAYVRFPDGKLRTVTIGIPDTYFSIPARPAGFVSIDTSANSGDGEFIFTPKRKAESSEAK